jgi:hypothetical protein
MMKPWIVVCLGFSIMTASPMAAWSTTSHSSGAHPSHRKVLKKKMPPKVQQHYSFIPARQPSAIIQKLQAPLQARIVQQQPAHSPVLMPAPALPTTLSQMPPRPAPIHRLGLWDQLKRFMASRPQPVVAETITPHHSWIDPLPVAETAQLSEIVAQLVQTQIPDRRIPLILANPPQSQNDSTFIPNLTYALQQRGYTIAGNNALVPNAAWIRYRISTLNQGLLVRIKINAQEASRLYIRSNSGVLIAASPISTFTGGKP